MWTPSQSKYINLKDVEDYNEKRNSSIQAANICKQHCENNVSRAEVMYLEIQRIEKLYQVLTK